MCLKFLIFASVLPESSSYHPQAQVLSFSHSSLPRTLSHSNSNSSFSKTTLNKTQNPHPRLLSDLGLTVPQRRQRPKKVESQVQEHRALAHRHLGGSSGPRSRWCGIPLSPIQFTSFWFPLCKFGFCVFLSL